jgi:hypothetical protein
VTTFFSIWTLKYYQFNNRLPGYDRTQLNNQNIDPDKAAFSLAPHDEESYAPVNAADHDHDDHNDGPLYGSGGAGGAGARSDYSDPYSGAGGAGVGARSDYSDPYSGAGTTSQVGMGSTVSSYHDNPFRQQEANPNPFDNDTEYNSASVSAAGGRYAQPAPTDTFADDARFPHADYDRIERH